MSDKKDSIHYLIRWAGFILVLLILSGFTYCGFKLYLEPAPTCESEVAQIISDCRTWADGNESKIQCIDKGAELMRACNGSDIKN